MNFSKTYFFALILFLTNLLAQENFLVKTKINGSNKMGSMQSESKVVYSEDIYYSNVKFSLKGKGLASLIRRDLHNGKIINLKNSTVSNIDFKKKKYSVKTFNEILKDKENKDNQNENDNQDNSDNENINEELKFIISEESELINGFEAYKLRIERDGTTNEIWFSKTLREPDFVIKIRNEISDFQNSWADMSIDLTEYGIDKDSIIIKMSTESEDGDFNFDLISFQKFLGDNEELKVPQDFKKVRKI